MGAGGIQGITTGKYKPFSKMKFLRLLEIGQMALIRL